MEDKQKEMIEWLEMLLEYAKGNKPWDTGGVWVCESHLCTPFGKGTSFDCQCGGPGMSPYIPVPKYLTGEDLLDALHSLPVGKKIMYHGILHEVIDAGAQGKRIAAILPRKSNG